MQSIRTPHSTEKGRSCDYAFLFEILHGAVKIMPRKARVDAPGALHHIIACEIEGRRIFKDMVDRDNFVDRRGTILSETSTVCNTH